MKKLSIKFKVTLWFTLMMTLIVAAAMFFLIFLGEKIVNEHTHAKLTDAVEDSFEQIDYRFGKIDIDDDLDFYNEGVYIAVYDIDGNLIYGRLPSDFDRSLPFSAKEIRTINEGEHTQYVLDEIWDAGKGNKVIVRGVLSAMGSESAFNTIIELAAIMFPILTVLAATVGYFLTKRAFKPVKHIAESAEAIGNGNDLSKRIDLGKGNDEIYKLANEFDLMFDRLQNSFENEKRFTSDASHELRTPIAVIIAQCEYALSENRTEEETRAALEIILDKSKGMASLISSLLTLARADRGHLKLLKEKIDFSILCETVSEEITELAEEKNIKVEAQIEKGVWVMGDQTMIIQGLLNLCRNGIKYGKENGFLKISMKVEDNHAVVTVKDNGIGISQENLDLIWERFFREDKARTNGNGLGLPLVKYIANAHGGFVGVSSVKGEGSIFTFAIPLM